MILSLRSDQQKILKDILTLYLPNEDTFECDLTYGSGCFYKNIPRPPYCHDLSPRFDFVTKMDSKEVGRCYPTTFKSIVYDPPYLHSPGKSSIMGKRFGGYKNHLERITDYKQTLLSCWKALLPSGVLVFKCQDIIEGGKQRMVHCEIWAAATSFEFEVLDLFVLENNNVVKGWNHGKQQHARKAHSYFWVFRKQK